MKKIATIVLLLLFINPFSGKAQTYYPFADSNAVWKVSWGTPYEYSVYHYELTEDTLIGLNNYHKLESAGNTYYNFDPNSPQFYITGYVGAFRNDTLAKKVYYIPKDSINESLLYDFNLITGDTIKGYMEQLAKDKFGSTFYAVIDSVDSVLVDSSYRKRWNFHTYNDYWGVIWNEGEIIEGIGNGYGLLEGLLPMMDDNGFLLCYSENGTMIYPDGIGTCTLITSNDFITKNENIAVYPNPANTIINFELPLPKDEINTQLQLFDITGKAVFTKQIHSITTQIDISQYPKGMYFYQLLGEKENYSGKLVIQ